MKRRIPLIGAMFLCLACLTLGSALTLIWIESQPKTPQAPQIETNSSAEHQAPEEQIQMPEENPSLDISALQASEVYISEKRSQYNNDLTLKIPKLNVEAQIFDGTKLSVLKEGLGLYEYAQLPSEENANVSIAGHRNGVFAGKITDNTPLYYINTLTEGDYIYLVDSQNVYQYLWQSTSIIKPNDWSVIYNQGYSCITITTCTPIGVADHRLVVRGELVNTFPVNQNNQLPVNTSQQ